MTQSTYFHVSSPLLAELADLLEAIKEGRASATNVRDRATIARTALAGVNVFPPKDSRDCGVKDLD